MKRKIEKIIEERIKEVGLSVGKVNLWKEEAFLVVKEEPEIDYFPYWKVTWFGKSQNDGSFSFKIRFSVDNAYISYLPTNEDLKNGEAEIDILL